MRNLYLQRAFPEWLHILRPIRAVCANNLSIILYVYFHGTELKFCHDTKFILFSAFVCLLWQITLDDSRSNLYEKGFTYVYFIIY